MSSNGHSLEILCGTTVTHRSEHWTYAEAIQVLDALGYPASTHTIAASTGASHFLTLAGHDHLNVKITRLHRDPEVAYNFVCTVRITGVRDGWYRTILDTPKFCLISNVGAGGIYTYGTVPGVLREMFGGLMQDGDTFNFTVHAIEDIHF